MTNVTADSTNQIIIRGARQHNLKGIDLNIPRNRLVVITGVSGSGKSSLAFDTLFAEGQRRYIEGLSTFARQFLQRLDAPLVDDIQGLSPAIAIEQKGLPRNPRSTVGTLTEIHDYLRLLYARLGTVYCPTCTKPIHAYTIPQMVRDILEWPPGSRLLILAPLGVRKEKSIPRILQGLRREGFVRVRVDGVVHELDPLPLLSRRASHRIDVVVDRLLLDPRKTERLHDSLETASKVGKGDIGVVRLEGGEKSFSEAFRCTSCGREVPEPTPSLFSFHHPSGMCPVCMGKGAVSPGALDADLHNAASSDEPLGRRDSPLNADAEKLSVCPECQGSRLNLAARSVLLGGIGIHEVSRLPVPQIIRWLTAQDLSPTRAEIADRPSREIIRRLKSMEELGLAYLTLDRSADTLSGGEAQRIRLVNQIGSPLSGVLYVLDEPSVGLHPRDHQRLLNTLFQLRDHGNTVIVVEHDRDVILQSDFVVDIGPGAGLQGGELIFSGIPRDLLKHPTSLTGLYLSGREIIAAASHRNPFSDGALFIKGARGNNLKGIDVRFPLHSLTCVTGVSGSGKTTLVLDTLYKGLARELFGAKSPPAPYDAMEGSDAINRLILVDQSPIGRTPRSTPATYTGLFSPIRHVFAQIPEARARGYGPSRFSFNMKGGRCEACKGEGIQRIEMFFLPDVFITCPLCQGSRYDQETLAVLYKGRSIADVLRMTVHEAVSLFENFPSIRHKLETLQEVGLGYLRLGQAGTTLSGGEAQRVKLAAELGQRVTTPTLYILDEPTTGLHLDDIRKLLHVLQKLVNLGHTVILIEHHLDVIKTADFVIDLGPEGGDQGGYVTAAGTPEEVARSVESVTGRHLRRRLNQTSSTPV